MTTVMLLLVVVLGIAAARWVPKSPARVRARLTARDAHAGSCTPRAQPVPSATSRTSRAGQVGEVAVRRLRLGPTRGSADLEHALVLEVVARSLRSGTSLTGALAEAVAELPRGDAIDDLERALVTIRAGAPVVEALEQWTSAASVRPRVLAGTALALGADLGGMPARSLDAAASGLRDRAALAREVRALSSQARSSAAVMVLGPPLFLAAASIADHRLLQVLVGSPLGIACVLAGVALDIGGAWWMAVLVRSAA